MQAAVQREHTAGQVTVAGIVGGGAVGGPRGTFEFGKAGPAFEEQQLLNRCSICAAFKARKFGFKGSEAHCFRKPGLPLARVNEEDGPAALFHQGVGDHYRRYVSSDPRRVFLIPLPLARGHQAARFAEDSGAMGKAFQGLESDPIGPLHHAHTAAHGGLFGDLHADVAGAIGSCE